MNTAPLMEDTMAKEIKKFSAMIEIDFEVPGNAGYSEIARKEQELETKTKELSQTYGGSYGFYIKERRDRKTTAATPAPAPAPAPQVQPQATEVKRPGRPRKAA